MERLIVLLLVSLSLSCCLEGKPLTRGSSFRVLNNNVFKRFERLCTRLVLPQCTEIHLTIEFLTDETRKVLEDNGFNKEQILGRVKHAFPVKALLDGRTGLAKIASEGTYVLSIHPKIINVESETIIVWDFELCCFVPFGLIDGENVLLKTARIQCLSSQGEELWSFFDECLEFFQRRLPKCQLLYSPDGRN